MMITPKRWFVFLSGASRRSSIKSLTILSLLFFSATSAQENIPSLQTELAQINQNGSQYQLGDRIQLSVRIPLELSQQLNAVLLQNPDETNPLDKQGWYLDPNTQVINGSLRFIVSPIKAGKLVLPQLMIMKDETHPIAKTTPLTIEVPETKANPSGTPSLLDTIAISLPFRFIVFGVMIAALLLLLGVLIYRKYWKNRIVTKPLSEIKLPPTPDHVIALRDLTLLYEQYPYSRENLKPVAFGVSQILKNYFSFRFKVDARESTTDEMLALLKKEALSDQDLRNIRSLFQNLDLIKFTELEHHEHFQKNDFLEFREKAKSLIETWAIKGANQ